jgi:hypothetical protein
MQLCVKRVSGVSGIRMAVRNGHISMMSESVILTWRFRPLLGDSDCQDAAYVYLVLHIIHYMMIVE